MQNISRIALLTGAALLVAMPARAVDVATKIVWPEAAQAVENEAPAKPESEKVFNAETFRLENGLEIVVIPNHRAPVVTHMVWYKVGAADEVHGNSGAAHFLEHLMFKGSDGLKPGEFSERIRALGGNDNAFTSQDYTAYYQSIAADQLETVMTMEAGRMRGLNPPLEDVASENKVILEERRQRTDNNPAARFAEQMDAARFINHPYGNPVIGWSDEMAALTWDICKAFYDKWYGPNNAILIVTGDVTGQQVFDLAKKIYGRLKPVPIPERVRPNIPPIEAAMTLRLESAQLHEPSVQRLFLAPSFRQDKRESLALQVLEELMGGGPTSRLYKALVVDQKIATSAGMYYQSSAWDSGEVRIYAAPAPGTNPDAVLKALDEQFRVLIANGIAENELKETLTRMQAEAVYARDSLAGPAMIFGAALTTGSSVDDVEYWPRDIAQVTAEQVLDVARKYLDPDNDRGRPPVTGYLLPKAAPAVEAAAPTGTVEEKAP